MACAPRTARDDAFAPDAPMRFPGKIPMRVVNDRPPVLESPWSAYEHDLTPNEAFYVRWHLEMIPTRVDPRAWRLRVGGHVERELSLSLDELKSFEPVSVVAVNQCSGNSRALFAPRVPGGQWTNGAMGNARWTGVRLRDILNRAGVKAGALEVTFDGMDNGALPTVPDFIKSLAVDHAREPEVIVAHSMNDAPLPLLNGFPVRLVVPGWYATYWVKALESITVLPEIYKGFWMSRAYRIPRVAGALETPQNLATDTIPIHRMNIRSFFVRPTGAAAVASGSAIEIEGIAFDGGDGIRQVDVSVDAGKSWLPTTLGPDLGRFSFRRFKLSWASPARGTYRLLARATSRSGETQPLEAGWNRGGYMRNVVEQIDLTAT